MSTTTATATATTPAYAPVRVPAGELRLTRRGRVVVLVLALTVLALVGVLWSASSSASDEASGYPTRTVVVSSGDTLWDIADEAAGEASTYDMVSELRGLNALDGGGLQTGQQILVPLR